MANSGRHCDYCKKVMSDKNMLAGPREGRKIPFYHKKCKQIVDVMGTRSDVVRSGDSAYKIFTGLWPNMIGERY
jgi:hypothetical protein